MCIPEFSCNIVSNQYMLFILCSTCQDKQNFQRFNFGEFEMPLKEITSHKHYLNRTALNPQIFPLSQYAYLNVWVTSLALLTSRHLIKFPSRYSDPLSTALLSLYVAWTVKKWMSNNTKQQLSLKVIIITYGVTLSSENL